MLGADLDLGPADALVFVYLDNHPSTMLGHLRQHEPLILGGLVVAAHAQVDRSANAIGCPVDWADFQPSPELSASLLTYRLVRATEARIARVEMQRGVRKKSLYPGDTSDMNFSPESGQAIDRPRPR